MDLSQHLRTNFRLLVAPCIAFVALESVNGVAQIVGAKLAPDAASLALAPALAQMHLHRPPFHETSAEPILAHNPFDSEFGRHPSEGAAEPEATDRPECDGLHVTGIVAAADPEWSLAVFTQNGPGGASAAQPAHGMLRRRGGEVGAMRVEYIGWDRVWMTSAAGECEVPMFNPPAGASAVTPATATSTGQGGNAPAGALEPWIARAIETVSPTERRIDRAIVPRVLEKAMELVGTVKATRVLENGKVAGLQVTGVRPGSLIEALGIANGDRLETLNGFDLTNPQSAMEAYAQLQGAQDLALRVNRGGKEVQLDLAIR